MKRNYIAKRFQHSGGGLSLDTEALAKYKDMIDLSIGDTDFTTDESIINAAFRDAKAGHTHYGDPKGDPELIDAVCRAWEEDFDQRLPRDHVLVSMMPSAIWWNTTPLIPPPDAGRPLFCIHTIQLYRGASAGKKPANDNR